MAEQEPITVVVRARGRTQQEIDAKSPVVVGIKEEGGNKLFLNYNGALNPSDQLERKVYEFDKVFGPNSDQSTIFDTVATPLFEDFLKGYNSTILVYGMTSSGKTYTMTGEGTSSRDNGIETYRIDDLSGIIPRVLSKLFEVLDEGNNQNDYIIKCSFLELYKEELRDLLNSDSRKTLKIYDVPTSEGSSVRVQNLEEVVLRNAKDGLATLNKGLKLRQVGSTKMNEYSSRSHIIFTLTLFKQQPSGELFKVSKMNLVDLAGSENIRRSGAEDQRALEAFSINQSLLTLGRVISLLVDKSHTHIPYRDSKLTRLLKDSLGGGTKTCLIATISPARINFDETVSTLEYATKAKGIQNKPQIGINVSKDVLVKELSAELATLKRDLQASKNEDGVFVDHQNYQNLMNDLTEYKTKVQETMKKSDVLTKQNESLKVQLVDFDKKVKDQTNIINSLNFQLEDIHDRNEQRKQNQTCLIDSSGKVSEIVNDIKGSLLTFENFESTVRENISNLINSQFKPLEERLKTMINLKKESTDIDNEVRKIESFQKEFAQDMKSQLLSLFDEFIKSSADIPESIREVQSKVENLSNIVDELTKALSTSLSTISHDNNELKCTIQESLFKNHQEIVQSTIEKTSQLIDSDTTAIFNKFLAMMLENKAKQQGTIRSQVESMVARIVNAEADQLNTEVALWDVNVKNSLDNIDLRLSETHSIHDEELQSALNQVQSVGTSFGIQSQFLNENISKIAHSLETTPFQIRQVNQTLQTIKNSHNYLTSNNRQLLVELSHAVAGVQQSTSDLQSRILDDKSTQNLKYKEDIRRIQDLQLEQDRIRDLIEAGKTPLRSESFPEANDVPSRNLGEAPKFTLIGSRYSDLEKPSETNTMDPPASTTGDRTLKTLPIRTNTLQTNNNRGLKRKQSDGIPDGTQRVGSSNKFQRVGESKIPVNRRTRFR